MESKELRPVSISRHSCFYIVVLSVNKLIRSVMRGAGGTLNQKFIFAYYYLFKASRWKVEYPRTISPNPHIIPSFDIFHDSRMCFRSKQDVSFADCFSSICACMAPGSLRRYLGFVSGSDIYINQLDCIFFLNFSHGCL